MNSLHTHQLVMRQDGHKAIAPGGISIIIACVIMTLLPLVWTAMRMWAQRQKRLPLFRIEDVLCYLALVSLHYSLHSHLSIRA